MRTAEEIKGRIADLEEEKQTWIEAQSNYQWTELEKIEGSSRYGSLQEKETMCERQITELEWVLKEQ